MAVVNGACSIPKVGLLIPKAVILFSPGSKFSKKHRAFQWWIVDLLDYSLSGPLDPPICKSEPLSQYTRLQEYIPSYLYQ